MKYSQIETARFLRRPNRFVAYVETAAGEEKVHVKNTGRCRELLQPNAQVVLEVGQGAARKTRCSLVSVWKGEMLVNMDSQAPNKAVGEALANGLVEEIGLPTFIKPEYTYGGSRFDFYYETPQEKGFLEVKGVTLELDGLALFPDAPTERGAKHLRHLIHAVEEGYAANVLFLIQMKGPSLFRPHWEMDPEFSSALAEAEKKGVRILVYDSCVTPDGMELSQKVPYSLE